VELQSDWTWLAVTEQVTVNLRDGHDPAGRAGNKDFVRLSDFLSRDDARCDGDVEHLTNFNDRSARNALKHSSDA